MKKYLTILAIYIACITVGTLAGITLALYVLPHVPWLVSVPTGILILCAIAYVDYRRLR